MWEHVILPLLAGIAIFISGMKVMELALHAWGGGKLQTWVERGTQTPLRAMATSTGATALLQSSTAISVITIGMVNAGYLRFQQSIGIILGANIGTCLTTELLGLDIHRYALPLLFLCFGMWSYGLFANQRTNPPRYIRHLHHLGLAGCGFACVLLGMQVMQLIAPYLEASGGLQWLLPTGDGNLFYGILAGALLTGIIQSSAAAIAMTMSLAATGTIGLETSVAIVLGANIGTCLTGFLASIGGSKGGYMVAVFHLLLNAGGALLFYPLIPTLAWISAQLSDNLSASVAHAQTIYNVACSLLVLPFCYWPLLRRKTNT